MPLEMRFGGQGTPAEIAEHLRRAADRFHAAQAALDLARQELDHALWEAVEARGYPLAAAARDARVTRVTAYRAIERAEALG